MLFEHLADAVYLIDPETSNIVWANRKAWESLGLSREDVLNQSVLSLQKDVHGLPQWADIANAIRATDCYRFIGRHRHQSGHEIAVEVNTTHFECAGRGYFLSVARDISNRVAQEAESQNREKQLWFALNEASDGLWDWDVNAGRVFFSPQLKRMLGYGPDEMDPVLDTWKQAVHPEDAEYVMSQLQEHMQGKRLRYEAEYRLRNRNGHYLWVHDRGRVCEYAANGAPSRVVGMVQDISERKKLELLLQEHAANDPLTGLANRREGATYLQAQVELCQRLNMPCRWGGEEFIVIAPNTTLEHMAGVAEKVRLAVLHAMQEHAPPVTISLGVASASGSPIDATQLLTAADAALYVAKQKGRNRVELAGSI